MERITKHEFTSLTFLLTQPLFLSIGFIKILRNVGNDYWISIIIGFILGLLVIRIFKKVSKHNNKYLYIIINSILLFIVFTTIIRSVSVLYLNKTPIFIISIPLLLLIYYIGIKNENTVFKLANIILIINILFFSITFFSLLPLIKLSNFLPIIDQSSILNICLSSIDFALLTTISFLTFTSKDKIKKKNYLFSVFLILSVFILIIGTLGIDVAKVFNYPEYMILKRVSILETLNNLQNIIFSIWIFSSFTLLTTTSNNIVKYSNKKVLLAILFIIFIISNTLGNYLLFDFIYTNITYILLTVLIIYFLNIICIKKDTLIK